MNREGFGNAAPACASCKHQRKRCDAYCLLAPYFPPSRYQDYVNAHKLFGLCNIQRIISSVEPHQRQTTANTLMYEGNSRNLDPVHGCLGLVQFLQTQIEISQRELDFVNQQLSNFRETQQLNQQHTMQIEAMANMQQLMSELLSLHSLSSMPISLPQLLDAGPSQPSLPSIPQSGASFPLPESSSSPPLECPFGDQFLTSVEPNMPSEVLLLGDSKTLEHGYNYQSTLEEGEDIKPFDLQTTDQIIESYDHYEHAFSNFGEPGESSNAESKARGKKPMGYASDEESGYVAKSPNRESNNA